MARAATSSEVSPDVGFSDPVLESQRAFRAVMDAMARPGRPVALAGLPAAPAPLAPVSAALILTLADQDTPLWLDPPLAGAETLRAWLAFHCGAPIVAQPGEAAFALVAEPSGLPPLESFALGSDDYPDRSTTLVLQVRGFGLDGPLLSGPGVAEPIRLGASPLPPRFWHQWRANRARFPRGVDVILAGPDAVVGLPRSLVAEAA